MPADDKERSIPEDLQQLVLGYQNTCQVMSKLWFWAMGILLIALPAAFYGAGKDTIEALASGGGLWILFGIISRFLVFEFRRLRAGWVARKIERRIPAGRKLWQAMIRWIAEHNDGNYLNTLLKKLGVPPRFARTYASTMQQALAASPTAAGGFAASLLEKLDFPSSGGSTQTCVYTTTKTQELRDGEWVTVDSSTTSNGDISPEEAMRQAKALLEREAASLSEHSEPIELSPEPEGIVWAEPARPGSRRKSRRKKLDYMPLELDDFQPHDEEEATVGAKQGDDD